MIVEGVLTTCSPAGVVNIAPMGPVVDDDQTTFLLRPFQTSTSFQNLNTHPYAVFHIVDDVLLIARLLTDAVLTPPETVAAEQIPGRVLQECCRWFELHVESIDQSQARSEITTRIVATGERRAHFGFNRAKHAVLELAILVSRVHLLPRQEIETQQAWLSTWVEKTGGRNEREAWELLCRTLRDAWEADG